MPGVKWKGGASKLRDPADSSSHISEVHLAHFDGFEVKTNCVNMLHAQFQCGVHAFFVNGTMVSKANADLYTACTALEERPYLLKC